MIGEEGKRYYALIKDFNTFTYNHALYRGRKHFCRYCLQAFQTAKKLKFHIKIALKLMVNKQLKCQKKKVNTLD